MLLKWGGVEGKAGEGFNLVKRSSFALLSFLDVNHIFEADAVAVFSIETGFDGNHHSCF